MGKLPVEEVVPRPFFPEFPCRVFRPCRMLLSRTQVISPGCRHRRRPGRCRAAWPVTAEKATGFRRGLLPQRLD
jgi:hypothetical protein